MFENIIDFWLIVYFFMGMIWFTILTFIGDRIKSVKENRGYILLSLFIIFEWVQTFFMPSVFPFEPFSNMILDILVGLLGGLISYYYLG